MSDFASATDLVLAAAFYMLLCGFVGAYVSAQKGRSQLEGLALGVLLGPLGPVVSAGLPIMGRRPAGDDAPGAACGRSAAPPALRRAPRPEPAPQRPRRLLGELEG